MGSILGWLLILAPMGVLWFIIYITSDQNKQKYYESTLYGIGIGVSVVFIFLYFEFFIIFLMESEGIRFWNNLISSILLVLQLFFNIKGFLRSKKVERLFNTTINHLINSHGKEFFTIQDLEEATKIPFEDDLVKLFNLAQKSGHIPANIVLSK